MATQNPNNTRDIGGVNFGQTTHGTGTSTSQNVLVGAPYEGGTAAFTTPKASNVGRVTNQWQDRQEQQDKENIFQEYQRDVQDAENYFILAWYDFEGAQDCKRRAKILRRQAQQLEKKSASLNKDHDMRLEKGINHKNNATRTKNQHPGLGSIQLNWTPVNFSPGPKNMWGEDEDDSSVASDAAVVARSPQPWMDAREELIECGNLKANRNRAIQTLIQKDWKEILKLLLVNDFVRKKDPVMALSNDPFEPSDKVMIESLILMSKGRIHMHPNILTHIYYEMKLQDHLHPDDKCALRRCFVGGNGILYSSTNIWDFVAVDVRLRTSLSNDADTKWAKRNRVATLLFHDPLKRVSLSKDDKHKIESSNPVKNWEFPGYTDADWNSCGWN